MSIQLPTGPIGIKSTYLGNTYSPAFVWSEPTVTANTSAISKSCGIAGCDLLLSIKAQSVISLLRKVIPHVSGISVCSQFETLLAREATEQVMPLHLTSPNIDTDLFDTLLTHVDYVSFNSLSQYQRNVSRLQSRPHIGLRVNPGITYVIDERYDPCRLHSKLGIPLDELKENWPAIQRNPTPPTGIHFHSNCESENFDQLHQTVLHLIDSCGDILAKMEWINLGGGYLFEPRNNLDGFYTAVEVLRKQFGLQVFIEPGAAFVRKAGYLVASVVDLFVRDGKSIALLDTTVNHMPEVFEFQFSPDVVEAHDDGKHQYLLAGCSCLAGDLFGEYRFDEPLEIGSRVVFENMGAYTTTKWHYFNGINFPTIYTLTAEGDLVLQKQYTYEDFARKNGVETYAAL